MLDNGELKEYDTPKNLLSNEKSLFFGMVAETGLTNAELLKSLAK